MLYPTLMDMNIIYTLVISWYNTLTGSAETYDLNNYDNLEYAVPAFIKDDGNNQPFLTFLNMVGHYFDNIWIYLKSVTDINLANNNLDYGISRDLVYQQLKSLGVKLYNSQAGDSVAGYLLGANTGSSVFDNNFTITGSYLNNIPRKDLVAELYKRIYHNLPLLLKTKGTVAGLNYLMTIFGIPNQTYYTIGSSSFYTPTGSNVTSSILNVKEFGGSLKSGLIKGYNNDKVRIVSNTITGSVLSSELSLQTFPTASSAFRDDDLHYIDISFSPQNQIDTYISGAIASNNPTWILDNYIGDPRQQYSGSYPDLDAQRKLYFETGVPGFNPFTASLLDYNGFIRLIEYFDNSLFKMLNDFVPERTSLSTGVTINSPVLERNKVVYSVLNMNTQSVHTGEVSASTITPQYGTFYNNIGGDKKPFFTGELSGSVIDINQYFEDDFNPYDGDWNIWNAQHTINEYIDQNKFLHSDWNILLNNVSQSVISTHRQNIEYIWGTTGSILTPAQLQDSYLTLRSYNISRYEGSKLTSLTYNTYTSGSYIGPDGFTTVIGDKSFGKTAAIDHNVRKLGLFTQIETSSFLPGRNNVSLKYLVDEFGNLTELNQRNTHWEEIQNTFVANDNLNISLFDNKKYNNQKLTDGNKLIFDSGYSYYPILYFRSCSFDPSLSFLNLGGSNAYLSKAINSLSTGSYISGSSTIGYPLFTTGSVQAVSKLFDQVQQGGIYYRPGGIGTFPTYSVQETGNHAIRATFTMDFEFPGVLPNSASWLFQVFKTGSAYVGEQLITQYSRTFEVVSATTLTFNSYSGGDFLFTLSNPILADVNIQYAAVNGYNNGSCTPPSAESDSTFILSITAGNTSAIGSGTSPMSYTTSPYYSRGLCIIVNGNTLCNGDTIVIGGTTVTISIPNSCDPHI